MNVIAALQLAAGRCTIQNDFWKLCLCTGSLMRQCLSSACSRTVPTIGCLRCTSLITSTIHCSLLQASSKFMEALQPSWYVSVDVFMEAGSCYFPHAPCFSSLCSYRHMKHLNITLHSTYITFYL